MNQKTIGSTDIKVTQIGLGCMGLSEFYGPPTDTNDAIKLLHEAIEMGVDHFDTAESYGVGSANETLLGLAFSDRRDKVKIATKFGPLRDPVTGERIGLDGSRKNCRRAVEASLKRLQTDHIDLYYLHRADPKTAIEETVAAMAELVQEGKIGAIGLSEVSAATLRRACAVHPVAAVQSEYSIFSRDIEAEVIPACIESGTTLVAYSPLGRGMLTGSFKTETELADTDFRGVMQPRFSGEAYAANLALVEQLTKMAEAKGVTAAEVALAWVMGKQDNVLPIAGTTRLTNLKTNVASMDLTLDPVDMSLLDLLADQVRGTRYNEQGMAMLNG
ncbi:MAG: aldo/keto reductase [bacterium]|nr:aldo/keto reductase [Gammaproteobacteria bacterium]HIL94393.1 aldo/keto reductase [Pseudomonadales bacterium]